MIYDNLIDYVYGSNRVTCDVSGRYQQDMSMRTDFDQETSDDEPDPDVDPDWDRDF